MKKSLLITLLALSAFQVSSEIYTMKQDPDETSKKRDREDQSREGQAPDATRGKQDEPKGAASQDPEGAATMAGHIAGPAAAASAEAAENRCGICMLDFNSTDKDKPIVKRLKLACCSYPICEKCLEEALKAHPACPQCGEPIRNIKMLKDKLLAGMMQRKIKEKRDKIRTEQDKAKKEREAAHIQEQIEKFCSGEDITAYVNVPADTLVDVQFQAKGMLSETGGTGVTIVTTLPILHFLAKGGPDGHDEYVDAVELVKYFVEEKGADINQKVKFPNLTKTFPGWGTYQLAQSFCNSRQWFKNHPGACVKFQNDELLELTPLEIAEKYGNHNIATYLREKIKEQDESRETAK
ncbi:MAG: RING finger protein [bacterium]